MSPSLTLRVIYTPGFNTLSTELSASASDLFDEPFCIDGVGIVVVFDPLFEFGVTFVLRVAKCCKEWATFTKKLDDSS